MHRLFVDQKWVTFALDLNRGIDSNLEQTTGCLRQKTITSIVGEFVWNKVASPQLYALTWNGLIEMKLNSDNNCPSTSTGPCLEAISLFTMADKVLVFATPNGKNEVLPWSSSSQTTADR
uniref:Bulb-type lectin domain-containing protein n=1 Tax=Globodera pallida TaxID=36090 RepID=A0A183C5N8_GLOPA